MVIMTVLRFDRMFVRLRRHWCCCDPYTYSNAKSPGGLLRKEVVARPVPSKSNLGRTCLY